VGRALGRSSGVWGVRKGSEMGPKRYRVVILSRPTTAHGKEYPVFINGPMTRLALSVAEARELGNDLLKAVGKLERMAEGKESSLRDLVQRILSNGDEAK